jgi:TPR repeat protein
MKRAVLAITVLLCGICLLASLRTLAIEATIPRSLTFNGLRAFGIDRAGYISSLVSPDIIDGWINDRDFVFQQYATCSKQRYEAISQRDPIALKRAWQRCIDAVRDALQSSPTDGRLWLELAIAKSGFEGVSDDAIEALRMSYATTLREGWIAKPRQEFAMKIWPRLPAEVRKHALEQDLDAAQELALGSLSLSNNSSQLVQEGFKQLEASAEKDNPYALEQLGEIYLTGEGVPPNAGKARTYLERAAEKGSIGAQLKLGQALWKGDQLPGDKVRGLQLIESAALTSHWAQEVLGNMLLSGELPRDVPRALALLETSANRGNPYALEKLGELYLRGEGVPADAAKAQTYFERAVEKGNPAAQLKLGQALWKGDQLPKDKARGLQLIESAAVTSHWAQEVLGNMLLAGELPRDVPRALALLETSANGGNPYALEKLGKVYLRGDGVLADAVKAQAYLERAVEKGSTGAQVQLGEALWKGDQLRKDKSRGLELIESAARTDPWGQLVLGSMLISGELPRDVPRAVALLEASANSGNLYALEKLGEIYQRGDGVPANPAKAQTYLKRADAARR